MFLIAFSPLIVHELVQHLVIIEKMKPWRITETDFNLILCLPGLCRRIQIILSGMQTLSAAAHIYTRRADMAYGIRGGDDVSKESALAICTRIHKPRDYTMSKIQFPIQSNPNPNPKSNPKSKNQHNPIQNPKSNNATFPVLVFKCSIKETFAVKTRHFQLVCAYTKLQIKSGLNLKLLLTLSLLSPSRIHTKRNLHTLHTKRDSVLSHFLRSSVLIMKLWQGVLMPCDLCLWEDVPTL